MSVTTGDRAWIRIGPVDPAHSDEDDPSALAGRLVARSVRIADRAEAVAAQVAALKKDLDAWATQQAGSITDAFLVLKADHLLFLVIQAGSSFDEALEESLTDLDLKVAQDSAYDLIPMSVQALPPSPRRQSVPSSRSVLLKNKLQEVEKSALKRLKHPERLAGIASRLAHKPGNPPSIDPD